MILCATIPYFYAMFTNDLAERNATEVVLQTMDSTLAAVDGEEDKKPKEDSKEAKRSPPSSPLTTTPSIDAEAFASLLRYAYTGSVTINGSNVQSLLIGASFLGLVNVQQACADYLKVRLNVGNVLSVKSFAFALGVETLVTASARYIHRHFEAVSRTEGFLGLDFEEVVEIVERDELNIKGKWRFDLEGSKRLKFFLFQERRSSLKRSSRGRSATRRPAKTAYLPFSRTSASPSCRPST